MQHSVAAIFFSSACLLCLDKISSIATDLSLALLTLCPVRSVVLSILRRDILICVYWNNMLRHCLCAASSKLCRDLVSML